MIAPEHLAPDVRSSLDVAASQSRTVLADYRAGLLDEADLRDALCRVGVVANGNEVWILDLRGDRWWRFDGVEVNPFPSSPLDAGFARLRGVIDELTGAAE